MRPSWFVIPLAVLLMCNGCRSHEHSREVEPRYSESTVAPVPEEQSEVTVEHPRVWRFPFVEIAIDPTHPRSVGVRVADDDKERTYVDLGVNWDD